MKHRGKVISFMMALAVPITMLPQTSTQTQPTNTAPPQAQQDQNTLRRAKRAAAGAAIGAVSGNAGKRADSGMAVGGAAHRHNRLEERRAIR